MKDVIQKGETYWLRNGRSVKIVHKEEDLTDYNPLFDDEHGHLGDGEGGILECGACNRPATGYDNGEPVCGSHRAMHVYGFKQEDFL